MGLSVIVLAGGMGTRMGSRQPKVLHQLAGRSLIEHVLESVSGLEDVDRTFVVHGHGGEEVMQVLIQHDIHWVEQTKRLGTGHAVQQVIPELKDHEQVLILYGDVPLIQAATLQNFVKSTGHEQLGLLVAEVNDPTGLGRIIRDEYHQVSGIIEHRDATDLQRQIKEINTGIYCAKGAHLKSWLPKLTANNVQGEYYLTDIVDMSKNDGIGISISEPRKVEEIFGANSRKELAELERIYQRWQTNKLMCDGVSLVDPSRVDIRGKVIAAMDCHIDINVIFNGTVTLADDCYIGPNVVLSNVTLGPGVEIHANSVLESCTIEAGARIGPYARVRPGTHIGENARVGNFVEIKNTDIGAGSKVNHLAYMGDATIGEKVNIGAFSVSCNYDGQHKHRTTIGDGAFIGSGTQLIAPVKVGRGAGTGAGTTVTKDIPDNTLVINDKPQKQKVLGKVEG